MYQGYRTIFWGFVFITFHINLGSIQILPGFVGCLIMAYGVGLLVRQYSCEPFRKALITAYFLAFISFISMFTELAAYQSVLLSFFPVVYAAGELTFCYYLFTGGKEQLTQADMEDRAKELEAVIATLLILYIIFTIVECFSIALLAQMMLGIAAIFGLILRLCVMVQLRKLMKAQPSLNTEEEME